MTLKRLLTGTLMIAGLSLPGIKISDQSQRRSKSWPNVLVEDKVKALTPVFASMEFWEVNENYSEEKCKGRVCTDMPTAITELNVSGQAHRVEHYAPKSLFVLEAAVDKAANSERWAGDFTNQGPFATTGMGGN